MYIEEVQEIAFHLPILARKSSSTGDVLSARTDHRSLRVVFAVAVVPVTAPTGIFLDNASATTFYFPGMYLISGLYTLVLLGTTGPVEQKKSCL